MQYFPVRFEHVGLLHAAGLVFFTVGLVFSFVNQTYVVETYVCYDVKIKKCTYSGFISSRFYSGSSMNIMRTRAYNKLTCACALQDLWEILEKSTIVHRETTRETTSWLYIAAYIYGLTLGQLQEK